MLFGFIILCGTTLSIFLIEARVYCGDPNANNLTYLGYSCPLKCANVIAVVEQLKIVDYHLVLMEGTGEKIRDPKQPLLTRSKLRQLGPYGDYRSGTDRKRDFLSLLKRNRANNASLFLPTNAERRARFGDYLRVLTSNRTMKYLQREMYHYDFKKKHNITICIKENHTRKNFEEQMESLCTRKSQYEDAFIRRLTRFLNMHANVPHHFTKSTVASLLRKILGKNVDIRNGELVVPKIVSYLRDALRTTTDLTTDIEPPIVHLAPRHCLGIYVPGCFCKEGFVERFGKCITLKKCLKEATKDLSEYLNRVIIH